MSVTHDTIIRKMMDELQAARREDVSETAIVQHVANVRLLADLIVDDSGTSDNFGTEAASLDMLYAKDRQKGQQQAKPNEADTISNDLPSDSIFDF